MKKNDKVIYALEGPFDWEDLDEAKQAGLVLGGEYTVEDYDAFDNSVKIKESVADTWISSNHFIKS